MPEIPPGSDSAIQGELPYMASEELESFMELNPELNLSEEEVTYLRMRRRNLSVRRQRQGGDGEVSDVVKLMAIGDDTVTSKDQNMQLFLLQDLTEDAPQLSLKTVCPIVQRQVTVRDQSSALQQSIVEVWVPPCSDSFKMLRSLYYGSTTVFLAFFSIHNKVSFNNIRTVWLPEIQNYLSKCQTNYLTKPPILIIGADAQCRRDPGIPHADLVSSEEAVQLAQEFGATKYIEVFTNNFYHVNEIIQQALKAISVNGTPAVNTLKSDYEADNSVFKEQLTTPSPIGYFNLIDKTFEIQLKPNTQYYYSVTADVDISSSVTVPTFADEEYTKPVKLQKPYPTYIKVVAYQKCHFPSQVLVLPIPKETEPPLGYFDVLRRGLFVQRSPFSRNKEQKIYYTTNGSKPTCESPQLDEESGLLFGGGANGVPEDIPEVINLFAVEDGCFRSRVVTVASPPTLAAPKVMYSDVDGVLKIQSQPHLDYRYTTDGSAPNYNSLLYTTPVMLPREPGAYRVRVAAFPKLSFSSRVVDVVIGGSDSKHHHHSGHINSDQRGKDAPPAVPMTRTARARIARHSPAGRIASRSPNATRPRSPALNPHANVKSKVISMIKSGSFHKEPPRQRHNQEDVTGPSNVSCTTRNNSLDFTFDDPIAITHLTVATPGGGKGPDEYSILVQSPVDSELIDVGSGRLQDLNGIQIMSLASHIRSIQAIKVQVHFSKVDSGVFRINNVQIHGQPAGVPCP
eukprot:TRINITY_DN1225_c5_g1_i1.p1 TRINITY_DN1225_c5_g1~~TRINITY_DN1225_c5_g1_i1.p1  ORF type:complete len:739 (+),score=141.35 TRINITY_DN1225_c5_g1_i1:69-2285(+)